MRSSGPPGPPIRPPARATHSSAPICGPVTGSDSCGVSGTSATSDLLRLRDAEDPGRPHEQEEDQDPEYDHVLVCGRPVRLRERLGDPDRDAPQRGAGHAADPADDGGGEGAQAVLEA